MKIVHVGYEKNSKQISSTLTRQLTRPLIFWFADDGTSVHLIDVVFLCIDRPE